MMKTSVIAKEDENNPRQPRLVDEWCEELGIDPKTTNQTMIKVTASGAL